MKLSRYIALALLLLLLLAGLYFRPIPQIQATTGSIATPSQGAVSIPWPSYGQEAFGAVGYGVLATNGAQTTVPIASIAKIATALAVLEVKPLQLGQQGPELTMGPADVALYQQYVAEDGSVVPVTNGEQITEYQALQAMMLPSANNMADSLADWAFGSQADFLTYANNFIRSLGLNQTTLADSSGFMPQTVSSASNLVILGEKALANPVLASIVDQPSATIPVAGTINNVNWLLGTDGVVGIKTGNTDQAGGCFLFAADQSIGGKEVKVIGAVLGSPTTSSPTQAISDSATIIKSTVNNFRSLTFVQKGQVLGSYKLPWGGSSEVIASQNLSAVIWNGSRPTATVSLNKLSSAATAGQKVGTIEVAVGQGHQAIAAVLQQKIPSPSPFWRIFHF